MLPLLLVAVLLLSEAVAAGTREPEDALFDQYDVMTGPGRHQTVLTGFLLGGAVADLVIIHTDTDGPPRLHIYALGGGTWSLTHEATLSTSVLFVDVANIDGQDRLIIHESGHLRWFDPDSETVHDLVSFHPHYRGSIRNGIPHVDITRDLNDDGRDDLVLPSIDGFWIYIQQNDGSFTDPVQLGPPEPFAQESAGHLDLGESSSNDAPSYGEVGITATTFPIYLSRVHEMDYNLDGRTDLVFWNKDHFDVHLQDERGQFDPVAETFTTDVPFDFEGVYPRAFDYSDQSMAGLLFGFGEKTEKRVLHSLRDMDGDGVADLVILTLSGRSLTRQRSLYEVHFGASTQVGIVFAQDAGATVRPHGKAGGMQPWGYSFQEFRDFDGDGQVDLLFNDVAVGLGGMMRTLVGNAVPVNLEFYRLEKGAIPDKPTAKQKIRRFDPFAGFGNIFFPTVLVGDVNGDDRSDLLVGNGPDELRIHFGVPGPELLDRQPTRVAVDIPYNERGTRLLDLNKDGRQDVLLHHAPTDRKPNAPNQVTLLIAR